ncbi:MAG TPA: serine/threonine-protein kinase [Polyangiales bacterium]|nr:serine/threonine-protein kinase [Polyangiales bacterium]
MNREAPLEQVGALIAGRYQVEELLGRGGMAAVYRVLDTRSGDRVALKRGWSKDKDKLQRNASLLEREYHTLAQLAHPRIIAVYDYGLDERGPYYTMELLDGADMESAGRLPWKQACAVLRDVASSLAILHSRGLVHRDVSSRNVRYSSNGYVKLLDFGAMTSTGVAKDIVGTPRFMAPEMLVMQTLDARTDLFALGALGYFLLTARDAYPARRMSDLRDVWRSRPQAPARIVEDVPAPLSALIMRLLAIDRSGRPQNAAEVIEQLITLAGLPRENEAEITRAYLTAPTLVGRDLALVELRRRILSLVRGDGGVLLVRGEAGSGRSRLLDACALEAKLLGPAVIRVDARDGSSGDWGVARAVARQLVGQFPRQALEGMRLSREVLGHVIEDLRDEVTQTASGVDRSLLIRELRDFVLSLSRAQRLLLVVDDADRIDEPSMAWLAALGHKADRNPILLVVSSEREQRPATAATLRLLQALAQTIELSNLAPDETEALLRSVFGDVRNLPLCAARIHGLSRGNPRATLELAQHLVDTARARYEAGSWVLPNVLDEADLPASLTASLSARLTELSDDARELLDALVLADGDMLSISDYRDVTSHADTRRLFAALDELASSRIVVLDGERCDLSQRSFLSVVQQVMPEERRKQIHGRLADSLTSNGGDVLRRAHHLLAAGRDRRAIELLCSVDLAARMPPVHLLATAIDRAERLALPAATRHRLHMALLINAPFALASESFRKVAPIVLRQLDHDSGLYRYRQLAHLPQNERLSQALAQTHQAYLATPEHERVHSVIEAIGELVRVSGSLAAMAAPVFDQELLETLPDVEPLLALSPALQVVSKLVDGAKNWVQGSLHRSCDTYEKILTRIAEPDHAGLDDAQYDRIRLGLDYTLGMVEGAQGIMKAERRAQHIENHRELRVNAWRIRSVLQLALGNPDEARRCSRRAQLLQAQEGVRERYHGSSAGMELIGYARLGDLLGVKSVLDSLASLAAEHRGWVPADFLGRAVYAELQRDPQLALQLLEAALAALNALPSQPYFSFISARHLHVLRELGHGDRACLLARIYVDRCLAGGLLWHDTGVAAALALARFGQPDEALRILEQVISEAEAAGKTGFALGGIYETRARIALWMNDRPSFDAYMDKCAELHDPDRFPAMSSALARLVDEGRQGGILPTEVASTLRHSFRPSTVESEYETIHSRIAECVDLPDRARCALTLLLQNTMSSSGYLYGMSDDRSLQLLASLPDPPAGDLDQWITQYARDTLDEEESATGSASSSVTGSARLAPLRYVDTEGRWFEAALLFDEGERGRVLVAALVLQVDATHRTMPAPELRNRIARELLGHGDALGWR